MKYTGIELEERANKEATAVETYKFTGKDYRIHYDNVEYIGNYNFDTTELFRLPYDENGEVDAVVELMDREEYKRTILANRESRRYDKYNEYDMILVVVVR